MKPLLVLVLIICVQLLVPASGQGQDFAYIDRQVSNVDASMPEVLAAQLTSPYFTQLEKVRSIFSWISQHIAYNTDIFNRKGHRLWKPDPTDTLTVWKDADEMEAIRVLYRRVAVCDGYARLFKTLCAYAGIHSEVVLGYARCFRPGKPAFRTNHTWNAVMVDGTWQLIDCTWGSGYVNGYNEFVQKTDERYFLTPPGQFIRDHYPEDPRWTLLQQPPDISEFKKAPFRFKSFLKYSINSYLPSRGFIEAAVGDTVNIELEVKDSSRDKSIAPDEFPDTSINSLFLSTVFLQPRVANNRMIYSYVVPAGAPEWLDILYNDDQVLRYKLAVTGHAKKDEHESKSTW